MGRRSLPLPNSEGYIMEPLKSDSENSNQDLLVPKANGLEQKVKTQIDRVTLNKDESDKVNNWLKQIKESSKGFLDLTRSDLVNFLIKSHCDELPLKEIKKVRLAHYSLIKHLNWITPQLKKALDENNHKLVFALQAELQGLEIGVIKSAETKIALISNNSLAATSKQRVRKIKEKSSEDKNDTAGS